MELVTSFFKEPNERLGVSSTDFLEVVFFGTSVNTSAGRSRVVVTSTGENEVERENIQANDQKDDKTF